MPVTKKTSASRSSSADNSSKELEAKVASLEKQLAALKLELASHCKKSEKEHAALSTACKENAAACHSCCEAIEKVSGGSSDSEASAKLDRLISALSRWGRKTNLDLSGV